MKKNIVIGILATIVVMLGVFIALLLTNTISLNKNREPKAGEINKNNSPSKPEDNELPKNIDQKTLEVIASKTNEMTEIKAVVPEEKINTNFKNLDLSYGGNKIVASCKTFIGDTPDEFGKRNYCPEYTISINDTVSYTAGEYNAYGCAEGTTIYRYDKYLIEVKTESTCVGLKEIRVYTEKNKIYENKDVYDVPEVKFTELVNKGKLYFITDDKTAPNYNKCALTILDLNTLSEEIIKIDDILHASE